MTQNPNTPHEVVISKKLPVAAIVTGVVAAAGVIGWAMVAWGFDQLITPRGQITVLGTTAAVMLVFVGVLAYWRAHDHRFWLAAVEAVMDSLQLLKRAVRELAETRRERKRAEAEILRELRSLRREVADVKGSVGQLHRRIPHPFKPSNRVANGVDREPAGHNGDRQATENRALLPEDQYLKDMSEAVRLGRELERRDPPPEPA